MKTAILRSVILPIADFVRRRKVFSALRSLESSQWWSRAELEALQEDLLRKLIRHVYSTVPFYREVMENNGIEPSCDALLTDLSRFPILTREDVRAAFPDRLCTTDRSYRKGMLTGKTGGSTTGEPLHYGIDRRTMDQGRGSYNRGLGWAGCDVGCSRLYLWGQAPFRMTLAKAIKVWFTRRLFKIYWVDGFKLDRERLFKAADLVSRGKIDFVYGYATAIEELCRFLGNEGINACGVRGVMTTAEMLHDETRHTISDALNAPVFDGYGCGELNGIAYECECHSGLHISMERCIVEVVDDRGIPLPDGEDGHLALTDLHNYAMPLIRYLNGDRGRISREVCNCGRHLDRIVEITGRTCDLIDSISGTKLHSSFFQFIFAGLGWFELFGLRRFQIVQEDETSLTVIVSVDRVPGPMEIEVLKNKLAEYLGPMDFQVELEGSFREMTSGKHRWTINKLRQ